MRKIVIGCLLIGAGFAAVCLGINGYEARVQDADIVYPPPCDVIPVTGNRFHGSPWECVARIAEAGRIKANPGLVIRDNETLHISYRGRAIVDLTPQADTEERAVWQQCETYVFIKALALYDPATARPEKIAEITCHRGEFDQTQLILPTGEHMVVPQASSSPNGRLLAIGSNKPFGQYKDGLTLMAWPSRRIVARFAPRCRALIWQDENHFTVTCIASSRKTGDDGALIAFDAKVWRDNRGVWEMQGTRWLNTYGNSFDDIGDWTFKPEFWYLPLGLPHYVGKALS